MSEEFEPRKVSTFANRMKELRLEKGLSQAEFANDFGVSLATVSNWERGERTPPLDDLDNLCEYFDCDINYLTGWNTPRLHYPKHPAPGELEAYLEMEAKTTEEAINRAVKKMYNLTKDSRDTVFALVNHLYNREVKRATTNSDGSIGWDAEIHEDEIPDIDKADDGENSGD